MRYLGWNRAKFTFVCWLEKFRQIDFHHGFRLKKNSPLWFSLRLEKGTIVVQVIIMTMEALTFLFELILRLPINLREVLASLLKLR